MSEFLDFDKALILVCYYYAIISILLSVLLAPLKYVSASEVP